LNKITEYIRSVLCVFQHTAWDFSDCKTTEQTWKASYFLWACNRQFGFGPWICQLQYLIIYFGIQTGVEIYNVWLWKFLEIKLFWKKG